MNKKRNYTIAAVVLLFACLFCVGALQPKKSNSAKPSTATTITANIETSIPAPTATSEATRCVPASPAQIEAIRAGVKDIAPGNDIKTAWAVKSTDYEKVWMVAAKIYGDSMEAGTDPAVWAISGELDKIGLVLSVNGYAQQFSTYPDASKTDAAVTISNDGVQQAIDCANTN